MRHSPSTTARLLLCGAVLALLTACTAGSRAPTTSATPANAAAGLSPSVRAEPTVQPDHMVNLTVYFRAGEGATAYLMPVVREVPVAKDLPRRALELLLAGPTEADGNLSAPLPTTTTVRDLTVEGGTATVDLSSAVIRDASSVGSSPANEVLALASLANTLTEFPSIERVIVTVEGRSGEAVGSFWGGWGLPEILVRDESLVGQSSGEGQGPVDLSRFSTDGQEVGSSDAAPVHVAGVRVRERISHTRFTIELADPLDATAEPKVPTTKARMANDDIVILLSGIAVTDQPLDDLRFDVDPAAFSDVRVERDEASGLVRLVVTPVTPQPFLLHSLTNPTRIVLDVKK